MMVKIHSGGTDMDEKNFRPFFELIENRRSIRAYQSRVVEAEKIQAIFRAIQSAPSAGNLQAFEVFVVQKAPLQQALARAAWNQDFIAEAPITLVFCAHPDRCSWKYGKRGEELYALQDATIACTFAMLAATQLGLGCVWVGAFDESQVGQILGLDRSLRPVAILPIGYARETPPPRGRRAIEDLIHEVF